jgi:Tir chaperone family protein CesT
MISEFERLISDLGALFNLKLHVDKAGACSLLFPHDIVIQLQLDSAEEKIFLFCKVFDLSAGKFRENILAEALTANAQQGPLPGILAYLNASNQLALFQSYPLTIVNGERLAAFFCNFLQMAESWKKALLDGRSAPTSSGSTEKPFGLKL